MFIRTITGVAAVLLLIPFVGGAVAVADETPEAVLAKILEAWNKLDALEVATSMEFFSPDIVEGKPSSLGILYYKKIADVGKYRVISTVQMPTADKMRTVDYDYLYDGVALYTIVAKEHEVRALKTSLSQLSGAPPGGSILVDYIKERFVLTVGQDTEIDGRSVYVIKGTQKPGSKEVIQDGCFYFDKETGFCIKMEFGHEERGPYIVFGYTDLIVNPDLPDDKFTFVLPEGITLIDASEKPEPEAKVPETDKTQEPAAPEAPAAQAQGAQEPAAQDAPSAEEQKETAPAAEEKKATE